MMRSEYTQRNADALRTLVEEHDVKLRRLPDEALRRLSELSMQVLEEAANADSLNRQVWGTMKAFREKVWVYHVISEKSMCGLRG